MTFRWIMSDRASTVYAVLWCVGFVPACGGAYFHFAWMKWTGLILVAPFTIYVAVMAVLSAIAFVRWMRSGEG